jgi:hypothetical protein
VFRLGKIKKDSLIVYAMETCSYHCVIRLLKFSNEKIETTGVIDGSNAVFK